MKLTFRTPNNRMGNNTQLIIDTESKTYKKGAYLSTSWDCIIRNKKEIDNLEITLKSEGYTRTN